MHEIGEFYQSFTFKGEIRLKKGTKLLSALMSILLISLVIPNLYAIASVQDATPISLNKEYTGKITNYEDNYYKFTLPSDGNVTLSASQSIDAKWKYQIINANGSVYQDLVTSDSEYILGNATASVGLPKGTYYLVVSDYYGAENDIYKFSVNFTPSNSYEKEFNDTVTTANPINLNQQYIGIIQFYDDKDFYKITLPQDGNVTLSMSQKSNVSWHAQILNSKGEVYDKFSTDSSDFSIGNATMSVGLPKGTYYVLIDDEYDSIDEPYHFKVSFTPSNNYEKEFNDDVAHATPINFNQTYKGTIQYGGVYADKDFYKFTINSTQNVIISMSQRPGVSWYCDLYNGSGNKVTYFYTDRSDFVKGNATETITLPKGTYYFVVRDEYNALEIPYQFSISLKTPALSPKNVTVTNNKGKSDVVTVNGLKKNDTVKIYNSSGKSIASTKATSSKAVIYIKQLGTKAGKIYVTVTRPGMVESSRVGISYKGEPSDPIKTSQVKIYNNKKSYDKIVISKVSKGDVLTVYTSSKTTKYIARATAKSSTVTIYVKQLGTKSGYVYITRTHSGMLPSGRTKVYYHAEK